jgi:Tol biopolymer transport system component
MHALLTILMLASALAQVQNEADKINTLGWTDSPYVTPDGQHLYFMYTPFNFMPLLLGGENAERRGPERPGHHTNPDGNPYGDSDIYAAERQPDGSWGAPVNLSINDEGADACPVLTSDGETIYWQKAEISADIFVAHLQEDGSWEAPLRLPDSVNTADYHELNPHISPDEQMLYFTSDRPGGYGGLDIYVSTSLVMDAGRKRTISARSSTRRRKKIRFGSAKMGKPCT